MSSAVECRPPEPTIVGGVGASGIGLPSKLCPCIDRDFCSAFKVNTVDVNPAGDEGSQGISRMPDGDLLVGAHSGVYGSPQPRLFRVEQAQALINRMGFNNEGVDRLVENVKRARFRGVLGINIGKNFDTPLERAADDYVHCLQKVYGHASYVTVNISSPNTAGLRELQEAAALESLLAAIMAARAKLADQHGRRVPIAIKIAPDLDEAQVQAIADLLQRHGVDAVIATNTTIARNGVAALPYGNEAGGLSGGPLTGRARDVVHALSHALAGAIPVIGVGGIMTGRDAMDRIAAGASLVQLYTGLIYRGPTLVQECIDALCASRE